MEFVKDAYCGLYCGACPLLLATEAAELVGLPQPDRVCYGCKSEKVTDHCQTCALKHCAIQKGYDFCHQCPDLPCADLTAFIQNEKYPYHLGVMKNLDAIRQQGVDAWLRVMDSRWRCPACGTKFAWMDQVCRNCGQPVANYTADL